MTLTLENIVMLPVTNQSGTQFTENISSTPKSRVDLDIFGAKEIRDVLKSRAHCLRAGFPPRHLIIATLNEIRDYYILKVGLPTYLSQMLGDLAKTEIQHCTLFDHSDRPMKLDLKNNPSQPLQRFIARHFHTDNLPFRVEVLKGSDAARVEVRYL
jgi:hypothetical protein